MSQSDYNPGDAGGIAANEQARLIGLALRYLDDQASDTEHRVLNDLLADRPDLQRVFVSTCLHARLLSTRLGGAEGLDQESQPYTPHAIGQLLEELLADEAKQPLVSVDVSAQLEDARRRTHERRARIQRQMLAEQPPQPVRVIVIPRGLVYAGIAALLVLAGLLIQPLLPGRGSPGGLAHEPVETVPPAPEPAVVASLVDQTNALWSDGDGADLTLGPNALLTEGQRLVLRSGFARLRLRDSAFITLQGPCRIELIHGNAIRLDGGMMTAICPEDAAMFYVQTPGGRITDLGTEFAIDVRGDDVESYVVQGLIEVVSGAGTREPMLLGTDQAALIRRGVPGVQMLEPGKSRLADRHPAVALRLAQAGIAQLSDSVRYTPDAPPSFGFGVLTSDTQAHLVPERRGVRLAGPVPVTMIAPGQIPEDIDHAIDFLDHARPIDSYLLHANLSQRDAQAPPLTGTARFERPILAVIALSQHHAETDALFGLPGVDYIAHRDHRGLEQSDFFSVSPDRLTLTFKLNTGLAVDDLRILVEGQAPRIEPDLTDPNPLHYP